MKSLIPRVTICAVCGITAAWISGSQGLATVIQSQAPQVAASLSPYAADAHLQLALSRVDLPAGATSLEAMQTYRAESEARRAVAIDPLVGNAWAIIAKAQTDPIKRSRMLEAAAKLGKRAGLVQSLLIDKKLEEGDTSGAIAVFNESLKTSPEQTQSALPFLVAILDDAGGAEALLKALKANPDWKNAFLVAAARDRSVAPNLATLRIGLGRDPTISAEADAAVIQGLVKDGLIADGARVYGLASRRSGTSVESLLSWRHRFPPFDWQLVDTPRFYARPQDDRILKLKVEPGEGGVFAQRMVTLPEGAQAIALDHALGPGADLRNVVMRAECEDAPGRFAQTSFATHRVRLPLLRLAQGCTMVRVTLAARAWSTGQPITGTLSAPRVER